jgi:glycosyltransferase involved in cell wall biosynthesis
MPRGKKIVFVANTGWSIIRFRKYIIEHLATLGHELYVLCPYDGYMEQLQPHPNIHVKYLSTLRGKKISLVADYIFYSELKTHYKAMSPDIIFHYTIKPNIFGSLAAASNGYTSVSVVTGLGYTFMSRPIVKWMVVKLYALALRKTNMVWFLNEDDRDVFLKHRILKSDKAIVLPGEGIDVEKFAPQAASTLLHNNVKGACVFLLFARITKHKGVLEYLQAAEMLHKKGLSVRCQLLGFFEKDNPVGISQDYIQPWIEKGYVEYLGATDTVIPHIEAADCIVLPSYGEGLPVSLLEAASLCKPIIASNTNGCRSIVLDGINGFMCAPKNAEDLMLKMKKFIELPHEEKVNMGKKGRALVLEKFTKEKILEFYLHKIDTTA